MTCQYCGAPTLGSFHTCDTCIERVMQAYRDEKRAAQNVQLREKPKRQSFYGPRLAKAPKKQGRLPA